MTVKRVQIIDDDTGLILKSNDIKYSIFDNDKGYLYKNKSYYIKGFQGIRLSDVIKNKADYANMHLLAEHLYRDTNMISIKRNKSYRPADIADMACIIGLNDRYTREFLQRMMQFGIIAKVIVNTQEMVQVQYHVNPLYFMTSKYLSPALYMMFRHQLDIHLPEWVVSRFNDK